MLNSNTIVGFSDGIGAYKITALDGKTYHYSLPVYQKEQFTRSSEKYESSEIRFFEEQNLTPLAAMKSTTSHHNFVFLSAEKHRLTQFSPPYKIEIAPPSRVA